jgi:FAD/FMN-containing dehydrogenase
VDRTDLIDALVGVVGPSHVLVDPATTAGFEVDWTRRFDGRAQAVVRPGSTEEVAGIMRTCRAHRVPLVPQGGNTGLVGGGVPDRSGTAVVLSTRRLDTVGEVDSAAGQVTVGAGVTLARLAASLAATRWEFGIDLAARAEATIGGMIATNAGGVRVLRHGTMRANVLGVEAVLGDGSVVSHLGGLVKDNTGFDLAGLLCGSEGTLAVVTAARLRLVPRWPDRVVVWFACTGWDDAVALAAELRSEIEGLDALEAVDGASMEAVASELDVPLPLHPAPSVAVLAEWAGVGDPPESLVRVGGDRPQAVAIDAAGRERLWQVRERVAEAIARRGVPHKLDVTLPLGELATFTERVSQVRGVTQLFLFGHLGDGNLHVNGVGVDEPDGGGFEERVLRLVVKHGGSISAEHGIGRLKAPWLHLGRTDAEIAAFAAIKRALDPDGILNPGVLFQLDR